jgi:hypothetical protein
MKNLSSPEIQTPYLFISLPSAKFLKENMVIKNIETGEKYNERKEYRIRRHDSCHTGWSGWR